MVRKTGDREPEARAGEGRFARWSRLKREAAAEKEPKPETETAARISAPPPATRDKRDENNADRPKTVEDITKDLPPIESLGKESDYTIFMRDGVPENTRTEALRKLWRSDPVYNEKFVLDIHMEDYNETFVPINAATDTLFRAGLGYLFDDEDKKKAEPSATAANATDGESSISPSQPTEPIPREDGSGTTPREMEKKAAEEQISKSGKKERG